MLLLSLHPLSTYSSIHLPIYPPTYLSTRLPIYSTIYLPIYSSTHSSIHAPTYPPLHPSTYTSAIHQTFPICVYTWVHPSTQRLTIQSSVHTSKERPASSMYNTAEEKALILIVEVFTLSHCVLSLRPPLSLPPPAHSLPHVSFLSASSLPRPEHLGHVGYVPMPRLCVPMWGLCPGMRISGHLIHKKGLCEPMMDTVMGGG